MTNTIANATLASVSETNRSRIMQHLYQHGISSRAQIAKALDLTPAAITKITAKLIEAGAIKETGDFEGRKNRRSIGLTLDTAEFHVIAVKFARSLVQLGVFDLAGKPLTVQELPQVTEDTIDSAIMQLHDTIDSLIEADRRIIAIGMAVPGPYLRNVGRTAVVSSMRGWQKVNFIHEFSNAFTVPVFVEQDARAGAMAQYLFDPTITTENLAYYLVGEGVGLGVIDHGNIINGALGAATEIGHVSIDINGKPCDCGNVGCLERYCSTPAIHEMILKEGDLIADAGTMTHLQACRALFALARGGDKRAIALIKRVARYVGFGCITIFNSFNPSQIVIGDIVAEAGQLLLDEVHKVIDKHVIHELNDTTAITLSALPADAVLNGAAAVAINQFLDHPSQFFELSRPPAEHHGFPGSPQRRTPQQHNNTTTTATIPERKPS